MRLRVLRSRRPREGHGNKSPPRSSISPLSCDSARNNGQPHFTTKLLPFWVSAGVLTQQQQQLQKCTTIVVCVLYLSSSAMCVRTVCRRKLLSRAPGVKCGVGVGVFRAYSSPSARRQDKLWSTSRRTPWKKGNVDDWPWLRRLHWVIHLPPL